MIPNGVTLVTHLLLPALSMAEYLLDGARLHHRVVICCRSILRLTAPLIIQQPLTIKPRLCLAAGEGANPL